MRILNYFRFNFLPADDLPIFPVSFRHLGAVKERVNLAREVDVLDLRARKESNEIGWLEKTAEEMDIMLDEFEAPNAMDDDLDGGRGSRKEDVASQMKLVRLKKNELAKMLQSPIFPRGFSYKYPTCSGALSVPLMGLTTRDNAVTVMRDALDKESLLKGDLLKNHKGKKGGQGVRKPKSVTMEKGQKGKGAVLEGAASTEITVQEGGPAKTKGGTKYYMPQPKSSTKRKERKGGAGKAKKKM